MISLKMLVTISAYLWAFRAPVSVARDVFPVLFLDVPIAQAPHASSKILYPALHWYEADMTKRNPNHLSARPDGA
jgi:hypothetical protein